MAECEADSQDVEAAYATIEEALVQATDTGQHYADTYLHRVRGDILLKRHPADPALAEEAYKTAIIVANEQDARSPRLQAALSLARLYQTTGRPAEAHAVLAPALEGFAPTPDMPEIGEAQALLAALAETDEVKAGVARLERRLRLQTDYAQALLWSKGWAADETKAAFVRTGDLAVRAGLPAERFPVLYGQALWSLVRGDVQAARDIAERFVREAEAEGQIAEIGVGHRVLGLANTLLGDFAEARRHFEVALDSHDGERDSEVREKYAQDTGVAARAFLALASWLSGDLHRARESIEKAMRLGRELGHLPSTLSALLYKILIESARNDPRGVVADAEDALRISEGHGMELYAAHARVHLIWARGRLGDGRRGADELRESLAGFTSRGWRFTTPLHLGFLAELEAAAGDVEQALAAIDEGLATAQEGGQHFADAFLHRLRGDILMRRDPANPAPAEEAHRTAIAIAKQQGARSYELLASLALAKLYQSTGRLAEAHAILAPALEGFAPTPEMPEIAQAEALLAALDNDGVKLGAGLSAGS